MLVLWRNATERRRSLAAFAALLLFMVIGVFAFGGAMTWIVRQHEMAEKYKKLMKSRAIVIDALQSQQAPSSAPTGPTWSVIYKDKGKTKEMTLEGATEDEVVKKIVKGKLIDLKSIVSLNKN